MKNGAYQCRRRAWPQQPCWAVLSGLELTRNLPERHFCFLLPL
jgi:hypothetical protein